MYKTNLYFTCSPQSNREEGKDSFNILHYNFSRFWVHGYFPYLTDLLLDKYFVWEALLNVITQSLTYGITSYCIDKMIEINLLQLRNTTMTSRNQIFWYMKYKSNEKTCKDRVFMFSTHLFLFYFNLIMVPFLSILPYRRVTMK